MKLTQRYAPTSRHTYLWPNVETYTQIAAYLDRGDLPHLLLHGEPGTGKTSMVKMLMAELDIDPINQININGSALTDKRGIEQVLADQTQRTFTAFTRSPFTVIVLEEADELTAKAQNFLKKYIDDTEHRCRYIFTTNHPKKINTAIHSRCTVLEIREPNARMARARLQQIAQQEGHTLPDTALDSMVKRNSTFRQMLNDLDGVLAQLDSGTKPDLTNQALPSTAPTEPKTPNPPKTKIKGPSSNRPPETLQARAKRVMGDRYQPPAVKLFDYGY